MDAKIFTTEKAAKLLGLPEWRIVRSVQMKAFGISPAFADAEGPGSRRLYDLENVCEFALASWLLQAGLRTDVIGRVLKKVRGMGGLSHHITQENAATKAYYLGVSRTPRGSITRQDAFEIRDWHQMEAIFREDKDVSLLVIPVGLRLIALGEQLRQQEQQGD